MIRKALVALDGTPESERALPWLRCLAPRAKLVLLRSSFPLYVPGPEGTGVAVPIVQDDALEYLDGVARALKPRPQTVVAAGAPVPALLEEAERRTCDLIALATLGGDAIRRRIVGGTTEKLLHHAQVPLLVVPSWKPKPPRRIRTVAVPVDGGRPSEEILLRLKPWAKRQGVKIVLVHAHPPGEPSVDWLRRLEAGLKKAGLKAARSLTSGPLPEAILEGAAKAKADLIALSTRGHGALTHLLKGGLVSRLIQATFAPVLVVRATTQDST
ncbi:MAG TPA: universal stress protein [Planctomycetota bacterium]|nr:universal stress protein [Planctomycetota bacterium]